jgi:hypothetical protein
MIKKYIGHMSIFPKLSESLYLANSVTIGAEESHHKLNTIL